ncbi:MAG: thermonuclease family protein [Magnetospiraceae bacterium]
MSAKAAIASKHVIGMISAVSFGFLTLSAEAEEMGSGIGSGPGFEVMARVSPAEAGEEPSVFAGFDIVYVDVLLRNGPDGKLMAPPAMSAVMLESDAGLLYLSEPNQPGNVRDYISISPGESFKTSLVFAIPHAVPSVSVRIATDAGKVAVPLSLDWSAQPPAHEGLPGNAPEVAVVSPEPVTASPPPPSPAPIPEARPAPGNARPVPGQQMAVAPRPAPAATARPAPGANRPAPTAAARPAPAIQARPAPAIQARPAPAAQARPVPAPAAPAPVPAVPTPQPTLPTAIVPKADIVGTAKVIDTGTLEMAGRRIRLYGVSGVGNPYAQQLAGYIGNNEILCDRRVDRTFKCIMGGYDLSEVVLLNGAGKANVGATQNLKNAESSARQQKKGVWQ